MTGKFDLYFQGYHLTSSPLDQVSNTLFQFLLGRLTCRGKLPTFLTWTSNLQQSEEGEEKENLTKMMVFNGNQRYGYNYIVRHKKPVGDQELEGYKIMRVTLGTGRKAAPERQEPG